MHCRRSRFRSIWFLPRSIPRSWRDLIVSWSARSSPGVASVIGREFSLELIQTISQLPARRLEEGLAELVQAEIIVAYGHPPSASYTFRHALVQDAAYASLLRDQRHAIHRRLAEVLTIDASGEAVEPQVIAWHFAEGCVPDRAVHYYQEAAERATGRFALAEMVHHLRNALRQVMDIPDSPDRQRLELALQLKIGRVLIDHEGANSDAVRTTFERALQLCLALDEVELLPRVYDGLVVNYHFIRSQPERIIQYTHDMTSVHERTGARQALFMQKRAKSLANFLFGHFDAASTEMRNLIGMYDQERHGPNSGMSSRDPKTSISVLLGMCLTILGHVDSGAAMSRSAIQHAEILGSPRQSQSRATTRVRSGDVTKGCSSGDRACRPDDSAARCVRNVQG